LIFSSLNIFEGYLNPQVLQVWLLFITSVLRKCSVDCTYGHASVNFGSVIDHTTTFKFEVNRLFII